MVRQEWTDVEVDDAGWSPSTTVSVVIPAQDCQEQLDRTLAALSEQSYPARLVEIVVVDDGSHEPLRTGGHVRVHRLERAEGHGSGRARHAGAQVASHELLLFLDADMIAARDHLEMHVRRHDTIADAIVLGHKLFVECDGITPPQVARAVREDSLAELFAGRQTRRHSWQESFVSSTNEMTDFRDDLFISVVGASVSIRRGLYADSGGFSAFGLRGIVDTEFGYRAFTAGGVLVFERAARSYHQGLRSFASRGDEIKQERMGLAANYLPIEMFRLPTIGRSWAVPQVRAVVPVADESMVELALTVDSVLASSVTDLSVVVTSDDRVVERWVHDYFGSDGRVTFASGKIPSGFPSPYSLVVPPGAYLAAGTVRDLLRHLADNNHGAVFVTVPDREGLAVELWATRALARSLRHTSEQLSLRGTAEKLFGASWVAGSSVGVVGAAPELSPQGMLRQAQPVPLSD